MPNPDPGVLSWSGSACYHVSSEDYDAEDYPDPEGLPQWEAAVTKDYPVLVRDQYDDRAR